MSKAKTLLEQTSKAIGRSQKNEEADVDAIIKELVDTGWSGSNEEQMKAVQLLKGLATSDDPKANAFMKKLDKFTSNMETSEKLSPKKADDYKLALKHAQAMLGKAKVKAKSGDQEDKDNVSFWQDRIQSITTKLKESVDEASDNDLKPFIELIKNAKSYDDMKKKLFSDDKLEKLWDKVGMTFTEFNELVRVHGKFD